MSDWQPIETAPRDGTAVDLWVVERFVRSVDLNNGERVPNAWWGEERRPADWGSRRTGEGWVQREDEVWVGMVESEPTGGSRFATHWMPLPEPPTP